MNGRCRRDRGGRSSEGAVAADGPAPRVRGGEVGGDVEHHEHGRGPQQGAIGARGVVPFVQLDEDHQGPDEAAEHVVAGVHVSAHDIDPADRHEQQGADRPQGEGQRDAFAGQDGRPQLGAEEDEERGAEEGREGRVPEGERGAEQGEPVVGHAAEPRDGRSPIAWPVLKVNPGRNPPRARRRPRPTP